MGKILLIQPPIYREEYCARGSSHTISVLPPLGLSYIASYLIQHGHECEIIDGMAIPWKIEDIVEKTFSFDIAGITSVSTLASRANQLIKSIKERNNKIPIIFGGPHATVLPEVCLEKGADYVVSGEGEITMLELVNTLEAGKDINEVKGIAFLRDGKLIKTPGRDLIENLDTLPLPARDLLPMNLYRSSQARSKRQPSHSLLTSRGCPGTCSFCNKRVFGTGVRYFGPDRILEEFFLLRDKYGAQDIAIWDDNFVTNHNIVHTLCDELIKKKFDKTWSVEARIDHVDRELLKHLKAAGCDFIAYGIESGSQAVLDRMNKKINLEQIRDAIKTTKETAISIRGYFMMGMPFETLEDMEKTIKFAIELNIDVASFTLFIPLPGTLEYRRAKETGIFVDPEYYLHNVYPEFNFPDAPLYIPEGISEKELLRKHKSAYDRYYFRPEFLLKTILSIRSTEDIMRYTKGMLNLLRNALNI